MPPLVTEGHNRPRHAKHNNEKLSCSQADAPLVSSPVATGLTCAAGARIPSRSGQYPSWPPSSNTVLELSYLKNGPPSSKETQQRLQLRFLLCIRTYKASCARIAMGTLLLHTTASAAAAAAAADRAAVAKSARNSARDAAAQTLVQHS
jgi:hypothetical protein